MIPKTEDTKRNVLVVDDEDTLRLLLSTCLEDSGFNTASAENGVQCLKLLQSYVPDLILLDVHMPVMNGFETAAEIRKVKAHVKTPIVFLTGASTPEALKRGFESGGDEYLYKPINTDELLIRIRALLRMRDAEAEVEKITRNFQYLLVQDFLNYSTAVKIPLTLLAQEFAGSLNEQQKEIITIATTALDEHIQLLQESAQVALFDPKNILLTKVKSDIKEIFEHSLSKLESLINQKKIRIEKEYKNNDLKAYVDADHIAQAFQFLISQAVNLTPENGRIDVTFEFSRNNDQKQLKFVVRDGGAFIETSELELMVDRFEQARLNKVAMVKNLSLTLCKMIIEAHEGKFWAENSDTGGNYYIGIIPISE